MRRIVMGTAGHIDHGKTSLIKALTGIDTDRLPEEKSRGMTIELGFAHLALSGDERIGIVDVPGHEKFVKHMVAGATGIDMLLLVVAADDGVMPQTREHLDICRILQIRHGLVAISKSDLVDEELIELVKEDVSDLIRDTFLEGCAVIPVSTVSGEGIPELLAAIRQIAAKIAERPVQGHARLHIDRVFTMKGFGTVVTGTLISGALSIGDQVEILPTGIKTRLRGIQVHGELVENAQAGMRTALNFQGVEKDDVERGQVVVSRDSFRPTSIIDANLLLLHNIDEQVKNNSKVRIHIGTTSREAQVILYETTRLTPGSAGFAQLRLDSPIVVGPADHFIVRSLGRVETIGGGDVLDPYPRRHKRSNPELANNIELLKGQSPPELISYFARQAGSAGVSYRDLSCRVHLSPKELDRILDQKLSLKDLIRFEDSGQRFYVSGDSLEDLKQQAASLLEAYHEQFPLKVGMASEELKNRISRKLNDKIFSRLLQDLKDQGQIAIKENLVSLASHKPGAAKEEEELLSNIVETFRKAHFTPPYAKDIAAQENIPSNKMAQITEHLVGRGDLVRIKGDLFIHKESLDQLKSAVVDFFSSHSQMTAVDFKNIIGSSRKYAIPMLEYLDGIKLTMRVEDHRVLRSAPQKK